MTNERNLRVLLASRPKGWPQPSDFRLDEVPVQAPRDGEVLVRGRWLSLDPYMRGRMNEAKSYVAPLELGAVMCGEVVGEVLESRDARFAAGDLVRGDLGWQLYGVSDGARLRKLETDARVPLSAHLSVVGMPGLTAYIGLFEHGRPQPGETVVVSGAAGAVGSLVGQLAKLHGCRAIGIAGGEAKCRIAVEAFGFDACLDYKSGRLREALAEAAPRGVDVYFDNVGGEITDLVLGRMNVFGRVPLCGLISQYNATEPYGMRNFRSVLVNRLAVRGFIVHDHRDRYAEASAKLAGWIAEGRLRWRETIAEGLRAAPEAFIGMLRGENVGKQLVRLDEAGV